MSQPVLVKAYGSISPADGALLEKILNACAALGADEPPASLEGGMLAISHEGVWFPADDVLEIIREQLTPDQKGRLDILDLENWRLERSEFANGIVSTKTAPLNNVLDFSGH